MRGGLDCHIDRVRLRGEIMQDIVFEDRYEFIPPHRGTWWPWVLERVTAKLRQRIWGIKAIEIRGAERLTASVEAGHGVIVSPNHCRPSDPAVLGEICCRAKTHLYAMASWNAFKDKRVQSFLVRRMGAFSVYREGMDRAALNCAIEILERAERPLVMFPEGVISRTNDRLNVLQDGVALIARTAARRRAAANPSGQVLIHPTAIKYRFDGDIKAAVGPVLAEIEERLGWKTRPCRPLMERIGRIGNGLLCLKEIEIFGSSQSGAIFDRLDRLIERLLEPLEQEWSAGRRDGGVVARVKRLRCEILPDMVEREVDEQERQRRWGQLGDCYLAQQLSLYPRDYLGPGCSIDRLLETVERFEEDLTDVARVHRPQTVLVEIGEAIVVPVQRSRGSDVDPLMSTLEERIGEMLSGLAAEIETSRRRVAEKEQPGRV